VTSGAKECFGRPVPPPNRQNVDDGMSASLKSRAFRSLTWSFVQEVAQASLRLGIGILLARLLRPKDFGLIGISSYRPHAVAECASANEALAAAGFGNAMSASSKIKALEGSNQ